MKGCIKGVLLTRKGSFERISCHVNVKAVKGSPGEPKVPGGCQVERSGLGESEKQSTCWRCSTGLSSFLSHLQLPLCLPHRSALILRGGITRTICVKFILKMIIRESGTGWRGWRFRTISIKDNSEIQESGLGSHVMVKRPKVVQVMSQESETHHVTVTRSGSTRDSRWRLKTLSWRAEVDGMSHFQVARREH